MQSFLGIILIFANNENKSCYIYQSLYQNCLYIDNHDNQNTSAHADQILVFYSMSFVALYDVVIIRYFSCQDAQLAHYWKMSL